MSKQYGAVLLAMISLAACSTTPPRTVETQAPVQVVEAQSTQLESAGRTMPQPAVAPAQGGGYLEGDGPGAEVPANIDDTPDAVPRDEPLHRYANRPYVALGKNYTPLLKPGNYKESGIASWYGKKFNGQRTSSGEIYDMYGMTAAHPTLPIPSYARVTNLSNHKSVVVRVNDRGPFLHDRIMDLSYTAAHKLGIIGNGSAKVEVESLAPDAQPAAVATADPVTTQPLAPAAKPAAAAGNNYLQLGAFKSEQGAESFLAKMRAELDSGGKEFVLYRKDGLVRVHVGPYASADEARAMSEKWQATLGFKPMVNTH